MEKVEIIKMGINGEGIAYVNHKPVFIKGAFPKETAEIEITEENDRYTKAAATKIVKESEERRKPLCSHVDSCGACALSAMDHKAQCHWKKELLVEALEKYGNVSRDLVREVHSDHRERGYRTQCKMPVQTVDKKLVSGLYEAGTNHFHPVDSCIVQDETLEKTRLAILNILNKAGFPSYNQKTKSGLRYIVVRTLNGKSQCTLITGKDIIKEDIIDKIMHIDGVVSLFQSINTMRNATDIFGSACRKLAGADYLTCMINGIEISLSPRAFFQLNARQAEELYRMAVNKIDPCDTLVEAYCGVGAMSLMAHEKAQQIIGIESIEDAVKDAQYNAERNGIDNVQFMCADAADGLKTILSEKEVDTLLVDPPRSGMDESMLETILSSSIKKIIYISCNPATLAKNLKVLKKDYQVVTVIPFDLFPDTPHIEAIAVLQRNGTFSKKKSRRRKYKRKKKA